MNNTIHNSRVIPDESGKEELSPYCQNCDADLRNDNLIYIPEITHAEVSLDLAGDLQFNYVDGSCDDGFFECLNCRHIVELDEAEIVQILKTKGGK
ncbi:hypothetical protein CEE37_05810 [candidate division LCP-89 bacterium B3_LCP]|uniref:Uncharacterized protein n=1 Tax=candidate division LCP-89 bacterium B3_LCP TaxID=2012998 RepID=A0A532V210_UNCL8|nr:MAG: hypothetical protein CEE37_05810 [candidate division LCP-89 bacterium B3_LCP]